MWNSTTNGVRTVLFLVLVFFLVAPIWGSGDVTSDGFKLDEKSQALGNRVVGSYLLNFTPDGPLPPFRGLVTVNSEGTLVLTETTDFGFGDPAVFGFNSPSHGAWEKTGRREIGTKMLFFNYSEDGTPEVIVRVETSWAYEPSFDAFSGTYSLNVFMLTQNPLDPSETPVAVLTGDMTGQRISLD